MPRKRTYTSPKYEHVYMSFDAVNDFRIREGLGRVDKGNRVCMCCNKIFLSEDIKNIRICNTCKNNDECGIKVCSISL